MNAITRQEVTELDAPTVSFSLKGREVTGRACMVESTVNLSSRASGVGKF